MKAQLKNHNGTPTVFLDDKPAFFGCHLIGGMDPKNLEGYQPIVRRYSQAGIHIYSIDTLPLDWVGPREGNPSPFDFTSAQPRMRTILDADPEALFLIRGCLELYWPPTDWWAKVHPEETEILSDGTKSGQSAASTLWRRQACDLLAGFIDDLKAKGLYDRVLAFQIGNGTSGEWIRDCSSMQIATMDYSQPMRRHFRQWLQNRYGADAALASAWADAGATFATAEVPTHQEQWSTTAGLSLRDARLERKTIDFYECFAELCADNLLAFCRTVRQSTGGEKLIGAFFGYIMELAWNNEFFSAQGGVPKAEVSTIQRSGHLGLHKAMHSPDIDFFISPYGYAFRGLGGDGLPMQPAESLRHHGKIYFMEEDTLMHNCFDPGGRNQRLENHIAIYQREFAQCLTHAHAVTWYEVPSQCEHPSLVGERDRLLRRFQELGTWALDMDRTPAAEVAVFLDDQSYFYESLRNSVDIPLIWRQRVASLNRFGAPHDLYLLDDLLDGNLPPYKLYVFLNPLHLDNRRRDKFKSILRRDGRVALWLYAAGALNSDTQPGAAVPQSNSLADNMADLTGLRFVQCDGPWGPLMHVTNFAHPITRGLPQDWFWGSTSAIGPLFHVEDPDAVTLGEIVYTLGRCKPGFAVKSFAGTETDFVREIGVCPHSETTGTGTHSKQPNASQSPFGQRNPSQSPGKKGTGTHSKQPNASQSPFSWHSVYMASPDIPAPVLRGVARFAGVHLYNEDGDVLYATPDLLSVHTVSGGRRVFRLPKRVEVVYDLFARQVLARAAAEFTVDLPPASTVLYYTGKLDKCPDNP